MIPEMKGRISDNKVRPLLPARLQLLGVLLCLAIGVTGPADAELFAASLSPARLRTEYREDPIGIDTAAPRLSWQLDSAGRGAIQTAYQIQVSLSREAFQGSACCVWDSGKVASDRSIQVAYSGPALQSRTRYYWRIRAWDGDGEASRWSEPAFWEMGLLEPADWQAEWITPAWSEDTSRPQPAPMLRRAFSVQGPVVRARAYATSLGLYTLELNGHHVGDQVLTPGWTSYGKRLQYQIYDITGLLEPGDNVVGATLGDGWYRGYLGYLGQRNLYGQHLALRLQLEITYGDGRVDIVGSDGKWKASTGPILMSDIYMGETYDARLHKQGWSSAGYDDRGWSAVRILEPPTAKLVAPAGPAIRRIEEIAPVEILQTPAGETVVDFGQNLVGWVRLRVKGRAGTTVTLRHAEVLDQEGNLYTENLRKARQEVRYTLKGGGEETYEPHFTFQGFRYVAVDGYPGKLTRESLRGILVHSDLEPTGKWESSSPLLNQLQHNIVWGQKGNFVDVPTDCPQRDERLGWTGDAQVFARTAAFNMDVAAFYTKWLRDLAADQVADGRVPVVIPNVLGPDTSSAGWSDVSVIIPWTLYLTYGDTRILEEQYPSMKAWVEYVRGQANNYLWNTGFHFGDWLAFATRRSDYPGATTGKDLIATAYFAYSTQLLSKTAAVLGKEAESHAYAALFDRIKSAFNREFVTPNGRVGENTQTAYALALQFGLLPEELRAQAAGRLVADIHSHEDHLTTGFLGTPYLCHVLSANGQLDTAYALLNQQTYPSWLYPVKTGATTIWERWDGIKPDGSFQDAGMNSFNHYAYGAIGEWMYRVVAGIDLDPESPGYKHVLIRPHPGGGLTSVRSALDGPYGTILSAWEIRGDRHSVSVRIPPNSWATVRLPAAQADRVRESGRPVAEAAGIRRVSQEASDCVIELGAGEYRFEY